MQTLVWVEEQGEINKEKFDSILKAANTGGKEMEKFINTLEVKFEEYIKKFEEAPIKTGIKLIIIAYVVKQIIKFLKES